MKNLKFTGKVSWLDTEFVFTLQRYKIDINDFECNRDIEFTCNGYKYQYVWISNTNQGLGWLYKNGTLVYSPIHTDKWKAENSAICQLCAEFNEFIKQNIL